jgi:hypothetical protein
MESERTLQTEGEKIKQIRNIFSERSKYYLIRNGLTPGLMLFTSMLRY